jgi:hypothetical protein
MCRNGDSAGDTVGFTDAGHAGYGGPPSREITGKQVSIARYEMETITETTSPVRRVPGRGHVEEQGSPLVELAREEIEAQEEVVTKPRLYKPYHCPVCGLHVVHGVDDIHPICEDDEGRLISYHRDCYDVALEADE